jgi:hypothetical protein
MRRSDFLTPGPGRGSGDEFARRSVLYGSLDRLLRSNTRFFAAAALVNEVTAELFRRLPIGLSTGSRTFLCELGASLEPLNLGYARAISDRCYSGPWLDRSLVRLEQQQVQMCCHRWAGRSGSAWPRVRRELNALLNAYHPVALFASYLPCCRQLAGVLASVRQDLGVALDFANGSHRIEIGCALIQQLPHEGPGR